MPTIESDQRLRDRSRVRYLTCMKYAVGIDHRNNPQKSLKPYTLRDITLHQSAFVRVEACILEIAKLHGSESARQTRNVISKYLYAQLVRHGVIRQHENPLAGMTIDYGDIRKGKKPSGGHALSETDYERVLTYLLNLDPSAGAVAPKRGPYTLADRVVMRRNAIDATLLQAVTGMRINEVGSLESHQLSVNAQNGINIFIPAEKAKDKQSRTVTLLDTRVAERIRERWEAMEPDTYLIPAPTDTHKIWDASNRNKQIKRLYQEMAEKLAIPIMDAEFRSHGWRTTLNMLYNDLPAHIRAAWFGHSVDVNHANYSDSSTDLSQMVAAATNRQQRHLRAV